MSKPRPLATAVGQYAEVPDAWMSATGGHAILVGDPALAWLKYHGRDSGFQPDRSPYDFLSFIAQKGIQFEEKWVLEMAPDAVVVCNEGTDVRSSLKVEETYELLQAETPVIVQGALWWAPERIYGIPDVLVHTHWLKNNMPDLVEGLQDIDGVELAGHYVVFDMKFTSKLASPHKARALAGYEAQVRLYSYMLGHLQGIMPQQAFLVTRDQTFSPLPVTITSTLNEPLDSDLQEVRDQFVDIKANGAAYRPWQDAVVASDYANKEEQWHTAKESIAWEKTPGRDPGVLYQIGPGTKKELAERGFAALDSLLAQDPGTLPLEECKGFGPVRSNRVRTILQANRSSSVAVPAGAVPPDRKEHEFFVDFEFFSNVNVDFQRQWPDLQGCEMLFAIGAGWQENGKWMYKAFTAQEESHSHERRMLKEFMEFLYARTGGTFQDSTKTAIYHWTSAEVGQSLRAAERQQLSTTHPLRSLPWYDLQRVFLDAPIGIPGAWSYRLKAVAHALADQVASFDLRWPGDLDQGLRAMVMGWRAYETSDPMGSEEMNIIHEYLEADCKALWEILKWLRSL